MFSDNTLSIKVSSEAIDPNFTIFYDDNKDKLSKYLHELVALSHAKKWSELQQQGICYSARRWCIDVDCRCIRAKTRNVSTIR